MRQPYLFRASIYLNVALILLLLGGAFFFFIHDFKQSSEIDGRPKGVIISLDSERMLVFPKGPSIKLPAGTVLQESTPQGVNTLGKISHREFLLLIKTDDFEFPASSPYMRSSTWMTPYILAPPTFEIQAQQDAPSNYTTLKQ